MTKQIRTVLPRSQWDSVRLYENHEPLVELREDKNIILAKGIKHYTSSFFVREQVAEKLLNVSLALRPTYKLVIIEGFRDMVSQQQEWDRVFEEIKNTDRSFSDEAIEQKVRMLVAKPHPLANHHCGGAIDVTLAYEDNTFVDMGTPYISQITDLNDRGKIPMLSPEITKVQQRNRFILRMHMEEEGFVWYPGEWWHYCFGDRMWAVYSQQMIAIYGSIELK